MLAGDQIQEQMDLNMKLSKTLVLIKKPKTIRYEEISRELREVIVGIALGDLHIRRRKKNIILIYV